MKTSMFGIAALLVLALGVGACKKAPAPAASVPGSEAPATDATKGPAPTTPGTPPVAGATLAPDEIANTLSKAVCARMTVCEQTKKTEGQPPVSEADCTNMMAKDLAQALPEKAKAIGKDQLGTCVAAITKATCEELNAPSAPKGCEFMD